MKILTVLTYYRPHTSGLTIYAERLAQAFVKRGHEVTIMTTQYDPSLPQEEQTAQVFGYVVGSLLLPVIFLAVGLVLRRIAARKDAPIVATVVDEPPRSRSPDPA